MPTYLGNEINDFTKEFKMTFYVEDGEELVEVPKTYDSVIKYFILLGIALCLFIISIFMKKKQKNNSIVVK